MIAYAEDVIIFVPSVTSLKPTLKTFNEFGCELSGKYNPSKSLLSWVKNDKPHEIFSDGVVVSSVNTAEHLRNSIGNNSQKHILKTNNDFVKRLNLIMSVFRSS